MPSTRSKRFALSGIVLAIVVAGGTLLVAGQDRSGSGPDQRLAASTQTPAPTSATPPPAGDLVEFRGEEAGFTLRYPGAWIRPTSPDPEVVFVAAEHEPARNEGGSILVRATALPTAIGKPQLAEVRKATDELVAAAPGVEIRAEPTEIVVGGMPGWYYLYTFRDPVNGQRGVHSHYFLFREKTMLSVVFQALPQDEFARLAPVFDQVANSIQGL